MKKLLKRLKELKGQIKTLALKADITAEEAGKLEALMGEMETVQAQITALKAADEDDGGDEDGDEDEPVDAAKVKALIEEAVTKARAEEQEKVAAEMRRLPGGGVPTVAKYSELWRYDNLDTADIAVMTGILNAAKSQGTSHNGASLPLQRALAVRLIEGKGAVDEVGRNALKSEKLPVKTDEIMQQDLTSHGDEWVGVAYSTALWESIRMGTFVVNNLPSIEIPPGNESYNIPIDAGDFRWYKVAEVTDTQTSGWPNTTITSSRVTTGIRTLTLGKMGARGLWSGELEEDSLIPVASYFRQNLATSGAEQMEHAIIDGDTATGATTNINDIGGTPGGSELFLICNGLRKFPLVTNTGNSRSGGALAASDFLLTSQLMGTAGIAGLDILKTAYIVDVNTYYKALQLTEVLSRDVFVSPTLENGVLTGIYGRKLYASGFMHFIEETAGGSDRKANTAGKIDLDTTANNTTGSILCVRWDRWMLGWRRRMTIETTRIARSDATEIVALARWGLIPSQSTGDDAAAITYNLSV